MKLPSIVVATTGFIFLMFCLIPTGCEEPAYTPKPRSFPKVEYPERTYLTFDAPFCDFTFEAPSYLEVQQDSLFFDEPPLHPCWFDLFYGTFGSRIHLTYSVPGREKSFEEMRADAFTLANKHNVRASYIDEFVVKTPNGVEGMVFDFEGPSATPFQFYLSDSLEQHFLRGSLYFDTQVAPDSLAPVYDFIKTDIMHMINTFRWKK